MRTTLLTKVVLVAGCIGLAAVPFTDVNTFWIFFMTVTIVHTLLLASLNLALGYCGLISLGHNALYAVGGYATAYFTVSAGLPVGAGIMLGLVFGVAAGVVLALPTFRAKAVYFGIITLAFLFLTFETLSKWPALGGFRGFPNVPGLSIAGQPLTRNGYYWFALVVFVVAMVLVQQLSSSAVGRSFVAVRENEAAAESLGIGVFPTKVLNLGVSGGLAGLAGALFAHLTGGIFPEAASFTSGIRLFVAIVVGGVGTFAGPMVGMAVVATVDRFTVNWTTVQPIIFAGMLIGALALLRSGITGTVLQSRLRGLFLRLPSIDPETTDRVARPIERLVARPEGPIDETGSLLRVEGLTKRFGGVQALDEVDLEVQAGTIHGLIGPNGSGKTTLVNLVSGSLPADGGRVTYAGREWARPRPHRMARAGLVRIFQRAEPFGRLLVIQNVLMGFHLRADRHLARCMLPLRGRRRSERVLRAEAFAVLAAAGLAERALQPVASLPYGEQRLLEIARAAAARPRLLILDEPATGLTAQELERLASLLQALRRGGVTILVIEHNMEFLMGLVDTVTVLDSGRRLAHGSPARMQSDPAVIEAYLGDAVAV
jgi:ABC-type branched-subunit amino acid transport system ATPase component/ABC-type branched-subunit amino acid transport system permease subunit